MSATGLSPRVRGNRRRRAPHGKSDGSIPACAGNPMQPRVMAAGPRSIPACAGEPAQVAFLRFKRGVYPRVCGGTRWSALMYPRRAGLSPRVRGNLLLADGALGREGSIPACAGEPALKYVKYKLPRVYPRVCGGTSSAVRVWIYVGGLSPRVRGNPEYYFGGWYQVRSIPACAGDPQVSAIPACPRRVYPRVCGGTIPCRRPRLRTQGLSPRVRGNHSRLLYQSAKAGSIPACAGEPWSPVVWPPSPVVYPRVCGGTPC